MSNQIQNPNNKEIKEQEHLPAYRQASKKQGHKQDTMNNSQKTKSNNLDKVE